MEAKPEVSIAFAVRAVEAVSLALTILILAEREIAPLPDAAETSESEEAELEAVEELLSSFAQPRRIRLIDISIVARKLYVLLMMPPNKSINLEMTINKISFTSFIDWTNESVFSHSK